MALKRLLRYIHGTIHYGLTLTNANLLLRSYSDADWAGDTTDRKSITGFCTFLGTTPISWCVKKQTTVAKSSTEAEYRSLSSATSDVIWLRRLLSDFQLTPTVPTPLYCDNTSAMAIAHNPVFHARTKHIEIDYQFIRNHINSGAITLHHVHSEDHPADLFTKPLTHSRFQALRDKLSIQPINT
ncbi:Retrovirus-related Pol polyprotein from transposon TNT 1-94 [Dendrobium catenatum]|uniref:Retrovirus-related Pol polyprotein from transposon TNT 1-94 n=1 Tax=Dendrobium catenatum TaxID=906689 RepID=A0A2I0X9M4_9ASPA|nr:Retrovirus-related Pol polyprotein from transposon TNT 1-94 [Dendrobium catenatum]